MKPCLDPGHGGSDSGAKFREYREKDVTLDVSLELKGILEGWGWPVVMTRTTDVFLPLSRRVEIATENNCDLFLAIHTNADRDPDWPGMPEARGEETYFWEGDAPSKELAEFIGVGIQRVFPSEPWRGTKAGHLYVTNPERVKMPSCLSEIAFIDHSETARRLSHKLERREIALAHALSLLRYQQWKEQGEIFE